MQSVAPPRREWTVLYYIGNNYKPLGDYVANELDHIAHAGGTTDRVAIVGQKGSYETGGDTTRFVINPPHADGTPNINLVAELGKKDSGDPETLRDFLRWGTKTYPADHYLVVMGGDGGAWWGALPDSIFKDILSMPKLKSVFEGVASENQQKFDIVDFDCCLMSCAEAADALKNAVNFVHASEEEAGGENHGKLMKGIHESLATHSLTVPRMLELVEQSWYQPTAVATVRCDKTNGFDGLMKDFCRRLLDTSVPPDLIRKCFDESQHMAAIDGAIAETYNYREVRDIASLADHIAASPEVTDAALKSSAQRVSNYVKTELVTRLIVGDDKLADAHGLSVYAPIHAVGSFQQQYEQTPFHAETGWGEVVRKYSATSTLPRR